MSDLQLVEEELRFKFYFKGQFCLAYNKGHLNLGDFYLSRPNFFPVYSPSGLPVTTNCAYRYNHHKSIFIGHAKVNGINFSTTTTTPGTTWATSNWSGPRVRPEMPASNCARRTGGPPSRVPIFCRKKGILSGLPGTGFTFWIFLVPLYLKWTSSFRAGQSFLYRGPVADSMDVEDGGRLLNSSGQENEAGTMGEYADWLDYSGMVAGHPVGVTLISHPSNPPSPFFSATMAPCSQILPCKDPIHLKRARPWCSGSASWSHEGAADAADIGRYQALFAAA